MDYNNKSVKENFIYNFLFKIIILFVPFITMPYVSRILGADNLGQYSFAVALVTYFVSVATLGSSTYGQRIIAITRDDRAVMSKKFWNIFFFRCISSFTALLLYLIFLRVIEGFSIIKIIVAVNILDIAADISWFFQGIEDFKKTITRLASIKFLSLIFVFIFVRKLDDTWKYTLIICGSYFLGNITLWFSLPRFVDFHIKNIKPFDGIREMFFVFLPTIATQVYMILDKTMIGWINKSDYSIGCYEQSEKLVRTVILIVTTIGTVVLPRVANLYNNNKEEEAKKYIYKAYRVVQLLALPLMMGVYASASIFIPIYLGEGFDLSIVLLKIFSLLLIFVSLAHVTGYSYLISTKQQNVYTISVSIAAIVNFILNLFIIPKYGAIGAAFSSVIAEGLGTLLQIVYCVITKQLRLRNIFVPSWRYYVSSFFMFIILFIAKKIINNSLLSLCIIVILGMIVYFLLLIILQDDFFIQNLKLFIKYMKKQSK